MVPIFSCYPLFALFAQRMQGALSKVVTFLASGPVNASNLASKRGCRMLHMSSQCIKFMYSAVDDESSACNRATAAGHPTVEPQTNSPALSWLQTAGKGCRSVGEVLAWLPR